jgi:hypothetical protein
MIKADKILSKVSNGYRLTDKELLYLRDLLAEALHLGARLGTLVLLDADGKGIKSD